jgi:hypothetical protein
MENSDTMKIQYRCNPDVILREEDESGALLFNPDTNQVKIINTTGLFIWKNFLIGSPIGPIVNKVKFSFEGVPEDRIQNDIEEFTQELCNSGFLGIVENL